MESARWFKRLETDSNSVDDFAQVGTGVTIRDTVWTLGRWLNVVTSAASVTDDD